MIAVAGKGDASVVQVARDFRITESCLQRWLKIADLEDGLAAPTSSDRRGRCADESVELRELGRRNKLLEQENEILRRATAYFARDVLPK
ncbi:transposase [Geodermatophilus tzadiensis]|uniref:Transposase n=1 Tax=Geodermatophilus tzadiensis TaxID=1137988 RepID=A0A2T0TSJ2_9ACTN|nr:transposase [Geodermatophilus tzadiensis]